MNRCLITGASGFVGANLTRRLLHDGHEVHALLRPEHQPWRLADGTSLHRHSVDLTNPGEVQQAVRRIHPDFTSDARAVPYRRGGHLKGSVAGVAHAELALTY